jgi:outer membrane protein assembly factor BamB
MLSRRNLLAAMPAALWAQRRKTPAAAKPPAPQSDWPQWHGPDRTNISRETGLMKEWPQGGPKLLWSARNLGSGYGTVAIQGDRVYVQGATSGQSSLFALDRADGRGVWNAPIGKPSDNDRGDGPRGTPTVDGEHTYVLTESGDLACVRNKDAWVLWKKNILTDYGARNPGWLISESPLVDDDKVIVTPGGRGAGVVALDKTSGKEIWRCSDLSDRAGYASCIAADVHGVRTVMTLTSRAGVGIRANDGKLMWHYERPANGVANCTTPVYHEARVLYTSAYDTGCGQLELSKSGDTISTREVFFTRDMMNHHGGLVLVNGYVYGSSNAILTCLDWNTGRSVWRDRSVGKGSLTFADGMLFLLGENNTVGLAEATHEGYREKGRFTIEDSGRPSWAHPVVCGGRLYIRNQGTLSCYDVRG